MPESTHPTPAERYAFDNTGYLVLPEFLPSAKVAELRACLTRVMAHRRDLLARGVEHTGFTQVQGGNTRIFYLLDDDPVFLDMLDYAPLMAYVHDLLGPMAHFHASDAIWETEGRNQPGWHMDGNDKGYRNLRPNIPLLQLKVGFYLNDMREPGQGNLMLVPGSHKCNIEPDRQQLSGYDTFPGAVEVCGPPGTAFMFHNAVWHTSGPWTRPNPERIVLYYAYELPWMVGATEHWRYPKSFYNRLPAERRKFFHGFMFDPPENRWG